MCNPWYIMMNWSYTRWHPPNVRSMLRKKKWFSDTVWWCKYIGAFFPLNFSRCHHYSLQNHLYISCLWISACQLFGCSYTYAKMHKKTGNVHMDSYLYNSSWSSDTFIAQNWTLNMRVKHAKCVSVLSS